MRNNSVPVDDAFDGVEFAQYLRRKWAVVGISCVVAVTIATGASLVWPKQYTATASLLIEPPAGNDPRGATAVSPVYLESLKTYERFASSDTVFAAALAEMGLQDRFSGRSVESIKRSVLKVSRPTSTKIVEISVSLEDAVSAQKRAQRIAEKAVSLNRSLTDQSTKDVLRDSTHAVELAESRVKSAEAKRDDLIRSEALDALQSEVAGTNQLILTTGQDLGKSRAELGDMQAELKTFHSGDGLEAQAQWTARQVEALRGRIASLEEQSSFLTKSSAAKTQTLESRKQHRESLEAELRAARADYELSRTKLSDSQNSAAYRGERLEIMDPGIVPQRPSRPNTPLNVMLAFVVSLVASIGYLAARFGYSRPRRFESMPEYSIR